MVCVLRRAGCDWLAGKEVGGGGFALLLLLLAMLLGGSGGLSRVGLNVLPWKSEGVERAEFMPVRRRNGMAE